MEIVWGIALVILLVIIYIERERRLNLQKEIKYITSKLDEIIEEGTLERVKLMTGNGCIKDLLNQINNLLDENHQNLMKYNKARLSMKKMLSNVSHDFKTPLTVVLGYMEMLQLKNKEDKTISKVYAKVKEVIELVNKFFDLAKMESGDKELKKEKINLCEICRTSLLDFYDFLEKKQFEVAIDVPEQAIFVLANEGALKRILDNLISNAIKYGEAGNYLGIHLEADENQVTVEVIDKGKGIEEKYKEQVFERMYTLEDSRSRAYQGSGLGLTITKELVEMMGGTIHLKSKPYEKTIFSFTLDRLTF